ncbi:citrate synthase [Alicyclobacillaceae bacterium I2511]|nr:citrate synthase [Alicyclobacillaceae bacterium I2511]
MTTATDGFKAGLEDVVANTSGICFVDGHEGRLVYRGYNINDLVNGGAAFEEVVYLLWYGDLPTLAQLNTFKENLSKERSLHPEVLNFLRSAPKNVDPMEILRTAVSYAGLYDPDNGDESREANFRKAVRLVAQIPTMAATFERLSKGLEPVTPDTSLSMAANFFYLLNGEKPSEFAERGFNTALILHADHELNASTFSARVTAGTLSDMYSAITSAVGTLRGPLHGGANEQVMKMLLEIGSMDHVESWIENALVEKKKIMGFGHRVYKTEDPRATHLRKLSRQAGELAGTTQWYDMSEVVEKKILEKKGLHCNVDFYSGSFYYALGVPIHLYTPIFAVSRISGWTAHVLEQYENNRLIRPRAEYTGPTHLEYKPLAIR